MKNVQYINAGAGSGKTFFLTEKLAKLIGKGETSPSRVILTTFTEKAAEELKVKTREKLLSKGMYEKASELESTIIGTVHSVAFQFIQKYWYKLGFGADVKALDEDAADSQLSNLLTKVVEEEDMDVFRKFAEKFEIKAVRTSKYNYDFWKTAVTSIINKAETFSVECLNDSFKESQALFSRIFKNSGKSKEETELIADVQKRIFDLSQRCLKRNAEEKRTMNVVSFNDMEKLFILLLEDPSVKEDICSSIDYVFVDEFQDSNPTQVKIFDLLSEIVAKGSFWVGDPKQAIYGFRGTDTALTSTIAKIIEIKSQRQQDGCSYEVLKESWRSTPELVNLVNKSFVPVFKDQLSAEQVELKPHREDMGGDIRGLRHWSFAGVASSGTGRLSYSKEKFFPAVAKAVCDILGGRNDNIKQVCDKQTGQMRAVKAEDIAILCYDNEDCHKVVDQLRCFGIPVSRDEEVGDNNKAIAVLRAILNFFICTSDLLDAELSYLLEDIPVEDLLENKQELGTSDLFIRLKEMKERLKGAPVSYIVDSVIAELDLENLSSKWRNGTSRKLCLETLRAQASSYEDSCIKSGMAATLGGFLTQISSVTVGSDIQEAGVSVLTYHKSKGLEWNIVILLSLDADVLEEKRLLKNSYLYVNHKRRTPVSDDKLYSDYLVRYVPYFLPAPNSTIPNNIKDNMTLEPDLGQFKTNQLEESARLLYVGATRARDYLITACAQPEKMKWLTNLGLDTDAKKGCTNGTYCIWGKNTGASKAFVESLAGVEDSDNPAFDTAADAAKSFKLSDQCEEKDPKYISPSGASPDTSLIRYKLSRVFPSAGIGAERITIKGIKDSYDVLGTCIHNIFATIDPGINNPGGIERKAAETVAEKTIEAYGLNDSIPVPAEVVRAIGNLFSFLDTTYGKPVKVYHELPFIMKSGDSVVTGEMDLVWETEKGCILVDFKNYPGFDNVLDEKSQFYAGKYCGQIDCYRSALIAAGKEVTDALIFYSVQGGIVRFEQC